MAVDIEQFEHPAWLSAAGAVVGYGIILAIMTAALFVIPWFVFSAL